MSFLTDIRPPMVPRTVSILLMFVHNFPDALLSLTAQHLSLFLVILNLAETCPRAKRSLDREEVWDRSPWS